MGVFIELFYFFSGFLICMCCYFFVFCGISYGSLIFLFFLEINGGLSEGVNK